MDETRSSVSEKKGTSDDEAAPVSGTSTSGAVVPSAERNGATAKSVMGEDLSYDGTPSDIATSMSCSMTRTSSSLIFLNVFPCQKQQELQESIRWTIETYDF
jgi:hypothetical protein